MEPSIDILGKREREILSLIVREHSSEQIAEKLNLSIHTIDTHRKNIIKKTKTKSIVSLVKYAIRCGLIEGYHYTSASSRKSR